MAQDILLLRADRAYPLIPASSCFFLSTIVGAVSHYMYLSFILLRGMSCRYPFLRPDSYVISLHGIMTQFYDGLRNAQFTDAPLFGDQVKLMVQQSDAPHDDRVQKNLKRAYYGGLKFPSSIVRKLVSQFPSTDFYGQWGMTEMCGLGAGLLPEDHRQFYKLDSTGKPYFPSELKIIKDNGSEASIGEPGEICIHRSCTTEGYLNDPERTAELFVDDWMKTGDYGTICNEGYLYILDRTKDRILLPSGGIVFTTEVEGVISEMEGVKEVLVVGMFLEIGQAVKACVIRDSTEEGASLTAHKIRRFCASKLALYKVPSVVEFLQEFPRTSNHKVRKSELKYDPLMGQE